MTQTKKPVKKQPKKAPEKTLVRRLFLTKKCPSSREIELRWNIPGHHARLQPTSVAITATNVSQDTTTTFIVGPVKSWKFPELLRPGEKYQFRVAVNSENQEIASGHLFHRAGELWFIKRTLSGVNTCKKSLDTLVWWSKCRKHFFAQTTCQLSFCKEIGHFVLQSWCGLSSKSF